MGSAIPNQKIRPVKPVNSHDVGHLKRNEIEPTYEQYEMGRVASSNARVERDKAPVAYKDNELRLYLPLGWRVVLPFQRWWLSRD